MTRKTTMQLCLLTLLILFVNCEKENSFLKAILTGLTKQETFYKQVIFLLKESLNHQQVE